MKTLFLSIILLMTAFNIAFAQADSSKPFAVVELFSSEGCSSCPPADALLRQITSYARDNHQRIYTLSFQVDYWNNLGWTDPFSSPQFSERQRQYAGVLSGGVYTPEMIVNGQEAFVGSDADKAKQSTDHYLTVQPDNDITLNLDQSGDDIKINYT